MTEEDLSNMTDEADEELAEEDQELEADRRKIWVQIDPYYYLTGDRYNPVILVRFTHPNETRKPEGSLLNNQRGYFSRYSTAINTYAHQYLLDHGEEVKKHDLEALKDFSKLVDDAFDRGVKAIKQFDAKCHHYSEKKAFGQKGWHDSNSDSDEDGDNE